jgi:MSHA biogenesis protein MshN
VPLQTKPPGAARVARDTIARDALRLSPTLTLPGEKGMSRGAAPVVAPKPEPQARAEIARGEPPPRAGTELPPGSIDRQARPASARERAEAQYRRASSALEQGRAGEAADGLRAALAEDPAHDGARQTLVGLLIEQRRLDDAQKLVQDALASRPNNPGFAMILARLQVDRGDSAGALATLAATSPYASESPDFQGFYAALLQRAGRHQEAAEQYRSALRFKPDAGVWWMGLGISLQAVERGADALEAYRRAVSSNTLSPELQAFVEQRIKQLAP